MSVTHQSLCWILENLRMNNHRLNWSSSTRHGDNHFQKPLQPLAFTCGFLLCAIVIRILSLESLCKASQSLRWWAFSGGSWESRGFRNSPRPPGSVLEDASLFLLWRHFSLASRGPPIMDLTFLGSGFLGVGWPTDSVCPGLKGCLSRGTFLF